MGGGPVRTSHGVAMLGSGLIADLYTTALHGRRAVDRVVVAYSRTEAAAQRLCATHAIPRWTTDMTRAVTDPEVDVVVIALPNAWHERAVTLAAEAGKAVLCTKPLGRDAAEARRMLETVERAGVFHGYLEDLVFTPKTRAAVRAVRRGVVGQVVTVRSREAHSGPHSPWFGTREAGGGALIDLGSHCVEIIRAVTGPDDRPLEVICWTDTLVHPVDVEDTALALIRFESGAVGQVDVSWTARGGMDLRDEINGTLGTIRLDHLQHTGHEMFTVIDDAPAAEKSEGSGGWQFPVADGTTVTGNTDMFAEMLDALDSGRAPSETFVDGYLVNEVLDACYRSAASGRWEPVEGFDRQGPAAPVPAEGAL